jgi:hypothetical protein
MKYSINTNNINSIQFDDYYKKIIHEEDSYFFDKPGKEHYRLLSYLSCLFNNSNIIDLGTHLGNSALALSYNKTNTIYTFDIVNEVRENIKNIDNIRFVTDDLFDDKNKEKYKELILSSPFIFLDVDPHNGKMEYNFIHYLQEINYQGFIVCDDIWYFKEMRDNFWYKINDPFRYDLTHVGHWSGTGAITFNENISFDKNDNSNWTLVTAYFNLTKCYDASEEIRKRDTNYYFTHSVSTLHLPYNLVIYCDEESYPIIKEIRPKYLDTKTQYIIKNFEELAFKKNGKLLNENFSDYRKTIIQNRKNNPYEFDNRNTASYYLFCMSRYAMLKEVIETNYFHSTHFSWINFCIERMGFQNLIKLDEALSIKRNKFSTCYIDYIPEKLINNTREYFSYGRCSMCSGFFTGNKEYMYKVCDLIEDKFLYYLGKGYGHADEQLYSPVYFDNPQLFEHYYGDYQQMITNYTYIYECPEPPIYNFIQGSYNNNNYIKCNEACNFVLKSIFLNKCTINDKWLERLFSYYVHSKKNISLTMKKLAYYTCYFGGDYNYSKLIPPIPSTKYDCYYFTNNMEIYNQLENTLWIRIFMKDIPIHNNHVKDSMEPKFLRCCPHKFDILNKYEYLCWFDSKLQVYENKVEDLLTKLSENNNAIIVLSKHLYSNKFNSVWDEFNLAMTVDKYNLQKDQNIKYINKQINDGYDEKINIHFCAGWILRKMCKQAEEFGELWYSHIQECGIEDQISLQFMQQKYINHIIPVEYQETWKYFYE